MDDIVHATYAQAIAHRQESQDNQDSNEKGALMAQDEKAVQNMSQCILTGDRDQTQDPSASNKLNTAPPARNMQSVKPQGRGKQGKYPQHPHLC